MLRARLDRSLKVSDPVVKQRTARVGVTTRDFEGPPKTEATLRSDLASIGVAPGMTLLVHSSLSAIGWVLGGAPTVVRALLGVIGGAGTLVMPASTPHCADPATWADPRVPDVWLAEVREHLPHLRSPGQRRRSEARFARPFVRGRVRCGATIPWSPCVLAVSPHRPSPASILWRSRKVQADRSRSCTTSIVGCCFWESGSTGVLRCISRSRGSTRRRVKTLRFPLLDHGRRLWREAPNVADDNDTHFPVIGQKYLATGGGAAGKTGDARSMLFPMRDLVDFAVCHFREVL